MDDRSCVAITLTNAQNTCFKAKKKKSFVGFRQVRLKEGHDNETRQFNDQ